MPIPRLRGVRLQTRFTFWPWGLILGPKFTQIGDDLLPTQAYYRAKFHRPASTHADIRYKILRTTKETKKKQ